MNHAYESINGKIMMNALVSLNSKTLRYIGVSIDNPDMVNIYAGTTVVVGPNGAGKTTLGRILEKGWNISTNDIKSPRGRLNVKYMEFNDIHSLAGFNTKYYQQRFESSMNDDIPTVAELMGVKVNCDVWRDMSGRLGLTDVLDKRVNYLSSGELRKLLLINSLIDKPDLLILDNPYIGLDASSRVALDDAFKEVVCKGTSLMLLVCDPADVPVFADFMLTMRDLTLERLVDCRAMSLEQIKCACEPLFDYAVDVDKILSVVGVGQNAQQSEPKPGSEAFSLEHCNVSYGARRILTDVNWTVRRGECWALAGRNGSGKSTLLSLIYADNPQVYSNKVTIFGHRRGSGESIWDVKRRIGYVSPEMHLYFGRGGSRVVDVVASGLNDVTGMYLRITPEQEHRAMCWLGMLHMANLSERRFNMLSAGEQRLVLLARTFLKSPEVLILDEPLHGLDAARKKAVKAIVNNMTRRYATTLIYVTHQAADVPECVTFAKTLT